MRVCIMYDCLFPWTIGGAERWYRNLAERLASHGHEVTYLTLTQWNPHEPPNLPGVTVVAVGPRMPLYEDGRRKIAPPLRFGWGVLLHLLRYGRRYDVVHTASFPFFSLLAAGLTCRLGGFRVICDWHEVWSRPYWHQYLGRWGGEVGWLIQRLCARVPQRAYSFSRLHASRLVDLGLKGKVEVLTGEYDGRGESHPDTHQLEGPPTVVYAGRMIPEKRVPLLIEAIAIARASIPQLRAVLFGSGPELERVRERIAKLKLQDIVSLLGVVPSEDVSKAMARALCVVQPSSREGYGMVVVESCACGVPAIVIDGADNAAVEIIEPGKNGFVVPTADPATLSDGIVRCWRAGPPLRAATRDWYRRNAVRLSLTHSLDEVTNAYGSG